MHGRIAFACLALAFSSIQALAQSQAFIDQTTGTGNLAVIRQSNIGSAAASAPVDAGPDVGSDTVPTARGAALFTGAEGLFSYVGQFGDLNAMLVRQIGQGRSTGTLQAFQIGIANTASLIQAVHENGPPREKRPLPGVNRLDLMQRGKNNFAFLMERGTHNFTLGIQEGTANVAEVLQGYDQPSSFNRASFVQRGPGNRVRIRQD